MSEDARRQAFRHIARLVRDDARQQSGELRAELERVANAMETAGGHAPPVEVYRFHPATNGATK